jgi:hypothetical protein
MIAVQLACLHAARLALLWLLVGVVWRRRAPQCWSLPVYAAAALLGNTLPAFWPERFFTPDFYLFKQAVYDVLKIGIAVELGYRVFAAFDGARRTARAVLAAVLLASTLAIAGQVPTASYVNIYDWQPRISTATVWLFTSLALLVVWYQVPIREWQRAIMLAFTPYLLVWVTLLGIMKTRGWEFRSTLNLLDPLAYTSMIVFLVWAAWRRDDAFAVPAEAGLGGPAERG